MPFDQHLVDRIRPILSGPYAVTEKKMFGGLSFLVNGHMCCGVSDSNLVIRTGADAFDEAVSLPHARPMDFTGRPMRGFVYVGPEGYRKERDLAAWIQRGLRFALRQAPK